MNNPDIVLKAMREGIEYSPEEMADITHLQKDICSQAMKLLSNGGLIEQTTNGRFLKQRKYKTRQRELRV